VELALPRSVAVREVGLRDGLQIEAPIRTADKLEMLAALVGAGLTRIEATISSRRVRCRPLLTQSRSLSRSEHGRR
jgi:hydroxymethylglutaryl-CoA lyase